MGFAVRMAAPPVQHLANHHELQALTEHPGHLFFLYAGTQDTVLWVCIDHTVGPQHLPVPLSGGSHIREFSAAQTYLPKFT